MANDITSFHSDYINWGPEREDRPDILYQYLKKSHTPPYYTPEIWYDDDRIVLDMDDHPIRKWREIPLVLSSEFEGFMMEGIRRLNSNISIKDFRARMPKFVVKGPKPARRKIFGLSTLGMRMSRFRLQACCIAWSERDGGDSIKDYFDQILPERCHAENSTKNFRDLTKYEIMKATEPNKGGFSSRAGSHALDETTRTARREDRQKKLVKLKQEHDVMFGSSMSNLESSISATSHIPNRGRVENSSSDDEEENASSIKRQDSKPGPGPVGHLDHAAHYISPHRGRKRALDQELDADNGIRAPRRRRVSLGTNSMEQYQPSSPSIQPATTASHHLDLPFLNQSVEPNFCGLDNHYLDQVNVSQAHPTASFNNTDSGVISQFEDWMDIKNLEGSTLLDESHDVENGLNAVANPLLGFDLPLLENPEVSKESESQINKADQVPEPNGLDSDFDDFVKSVDFRNVAPSDAWEEVTIIAALHYTREHFRFLTGLEPRLPNPKLSYIDQYNYLQADYESIHTGLNLAAPVPTLMILDSWGHSIRNWKAPIAEDGTYMYLSADWMSLDGLF